MFGSYELFFFEKSEVKVSYQSVVFLGRCVFGKFQVNFYRVGVKGVVKKEIFIMKIYFYLIFKGFLKFINL